MGMPLKDRDWKTTSPFCGSFLGSHPFQSATTSLVLGCGRHACWACDWMQKNIMRPESQRIGADPCIISWMSRYSSWLQSTAWLSWLLGRRSYNCLSNFGNHQENDPFFSPWGYRAPEIILGQSHLGSETPEMRMWDMFVVVAMIWGTPGDLM